MRLGPLHYPGKLGPVVDFLKGELLYGGSCYYHAVEVFLLYLIEGPVVLNEVLPAGVLGNVGCHAKKLYVHLDRGIRECS